MADAEGDGASADEEPESHAHADRGSRREDYLDEQEEESFPASDPHSDWSGPA